MKRMQALSEIQLESLKAVAKQDARLNAIVTLMSRHFIRASELTALKVSHVCLHSKTLSITRLKGSISKVEAFLPGDMEALSLWLAVKPTSPYLFPGRAGRMTRQTLYNLFKDAAREAGIPRTSGAPHALRHTIGQKMAEAGVPARAIQQAAGHKNLNSTASYFEFRESFVDAEKTRALGL
jgi:integrase